MTLRHREAPEHRRHRTRPAAANGTKNPVYLINGLFSGSPENVVGMSPQWGTIEELDALSAQVEVSSESESGCAFGGQNRFTERARGYRGYFRHPGSSLPYIETPPPPDLDQIPNFRSPLALNPETLDLGCPEPFDLAIQRARLR